MKNLEIKCMFEDDVHQLYQVSEHDELNTYPWYIRFNDYPLPVIMQKDDRLDDLYWLPCD